jgi:putative ABC transport system permease protein
VILNESMARAHFGDADPIGRLISFSNDQNAIRGGNVGPRNWLEIVGVVADSREYGMDHQGVHTYYRPSLQVGDATSVLVAHQGDPGPVAEHVRGVIRQMEPTRAIEGVQTMAQLVEGDLAPSRLNAVLFGSLAMLSLIIAALGVLSTLSFAVSQRVREFGVRMALGAGRGSILRAVLGEGVALVVAALVIGASGALAIGRFGAALLFEVGSFDVSSMVVAGLVLGLAALAATWFPAVRATRVQPSRALQGP